MTSSEPTLDHITGEIVDAAYKLHVGLGPGLLESVYEAVLARDLQRRGFRIERQKAISFDYDGLHFNDAFRVDLVVESLVVVEIKSVERLPPVHAKQLLTCLRLLNLQVRSSHQFWRADLAGWPAPDCQRAELLRVSAPPRLRASA